MTADQALKNQNIELIFRGQVVDVVPAQATQPGYRATFEVDRVWKGSVPGRIDVYVWELHEGVPKFEKGARYTALAAALSDPRLRQRLGLSNREGPQYIAAGCSATLTPDFNDALGPGHAPALSGKQREHVIDLMTSPDVGAAADVVPEGKRLRLNPPVVVVSHEPQPKVPLILLPPRLDRTQYRWGDRFVYEWIVENRGDQPITFPTLTADDRISREMPGAKAVLIGLRFADERLDGELVEVRALFGAESVAGSLIVVAPGERVRVRAPGTWRTFRDSKKVDASEQTYLVKASIQMMGPLRMELVAHSEGSVEVSIRK